MVHFRQDEDVTRAPQLDLEWCKSQTTAASNSSESTPVVNVLHVVHSPDFSQVHVYSQPDHQQQGVALDLVKTTNQAASSSSTMN
mmetsp:Transcript_13872/g.20907  ORF Transcript_13872/g.20907 Transcript_13872/m.20907 type:complete len:85 (+) Transcript_13872:342-596(+)